MSASNRPRILVISISQTGQDPRVLAHLEILRAYGDVVTIGLGPRSFDVSEHVELSARRSPLTTLIVLGSLGLRFFRAVNRSLWYFTQIRRHFAGRRVEADLICANDANTLSIAFELAKRSGARVWADMHEYAPLENESDWKWKLLVQPYVSAMCAQYLPLADAITTVGEGIRTRYEKDSGQPVGLIRNTAPFTDRLSRSHNETGLNTGIFRLVHVGVAIRARVLENMMEAIASEPSVALDLYILPTDPGYFAELQTRAKRQGNVELCEPVTSSQIIETLSRYDCGIITIPPTNFNYANCLPNKLFQYIQARIPVITGPTPEIASVVLTYGVGWVTEDFSPNAIRQTIQSAQVSDPEALIAPLDYAARELSRDTDDAIRHEVIRRLLDSKGQENPG